MEDATYTLIDKYLQGELQGEDLKAFEEKLNLDAEFAQEVTLYKDIENTLHSRFANKTAENALRSTLQGLGKEHIITEKIVTKQPKVIRLNRFKNLMVAASIAAIIGLFVFNQNPSYSDFANYDSIELTVRGDANKHIQKAQEAFNTKKYTEAITHFNALLKKDTSNVEFQYYKAISQIETNMFQQADALLATISEGNSVYKNKALWQLALSKLKQKQYDACKKVLTKIPTIAEDYQKAQKLLGKL